MMNDLQSLLGKHRKCGPGIENPAIYLPDDVRQIYRYANGVLFGVNKECGCNFWDGKVGYAYKILPFESLVSVYNHKDCNRGSEIAERMKYWAMIIDYGDFDYIAVDLSNEGKGKMIDVWHECIGDIEYHPVVAENIMDFIDRCKNESGVWW